MSYVLCLSTVYTPTSTFYTTPAMTIDNLLTLGLGDLVRAHKMSGLYFNYLRSALDFTLKNSSLKDLPKQVLLPAFICPVVPEVFRRNGYKITFADANLDTFNMDLKDAHKFPITLVCHTFGARSEMPNDTVVLEDCAHFVSKQREGDFAFYSLGKQMPNIRGGLVDTDENLDEPYEHLLSDRYSWKEIFLKIGGPQRALINSVRASKDLPECEIEKWNVLKASWLTFGFNESKNHEVYGQLVGQFEKLGLAEKFTMQKMPEGSCPFNFSIRLLDDDPNKRDEILLKLRKQSVFGDRLWYNAAGGMPNADLLSRTVINLPLHPQVLIKLKNVL